MKYHPRVGYTYMPNARFRAPEAGGYLVRANSTGFRSEREFVKSKPQGASRLLLFGDSQSAGHGIPNPMRYSDLLEQAMPGLEVYNYALSGSGPDQQFLAYSEFAHVEHDLLVISLYVETVRRISRGVVQSRDRDGSVLYYAKPYFSLGDDGLTLHNTPVRKEAWTDETLPETFRDQVYAYTERDLLAGHQQAARRLKTLLPIAPLRRALRKLAVQATAYQPVPDYDSPESPSWCLLREILREWIARSPVPVLLVTLPHYAYFLDGADPAGYLQRYTELTAEISCGYYDALEDMLALPEPERASIWSKESGHLSRRGHEMLANWLEPHISRMLPSAQGSRSRG
jgi:hypothetical protein